MPEISETCGSGEFRILQQAVVFVSGLPEKHLKRGGPVKAVHYNKPSELHAKKVKNALRFRAN